MRWAWRERWFWERTERALRCLADDDPACAAAASPGVLETVRLMGGFFDE